LPVPRHCRLTQHVGNPPQQAAAAAAIYPIVSFIFLIFCRLSFIGTSKPVVRVTESNRRQVLSNGRRRRYTAE